MKVQAQPLHWGLQQKGSWPVRAEDAESTYDESHMKPGRLYIPEGSSHFLLTGDSGLAEPAFTMFFLEGQPLSNC